MLILVAKSYIEREICILCANWKGPQRDLLELSGFYNVIPPKNLFLGLHDAVVEARKRYEKRAGYSRSETEPRVICHFHNTLDGHFVVSLRDTFQFDHPEFDVLFQYVSFPRCASPRMAFNSAPCFCGQAARSPACALDFAGYFLFVGCRDVGCTTPSVAGARLLELLPKLAPCRYRTNLINTHSFIGAGRATT